MVEEVLGVFNAYLIMLEERGSKRSCTFLVTDSRLVVMLPEGMNPWIGVVAVIAFVVSLVGLFLRDLTLFLVGLGVGFLVVFLLVLVDFGVRYRRQSRIKKLAPDEILRASKRNFEIPHSDIVRVKHEVVERYEPPSISHIFLPSLPYKTHMVEFDTQKGKHVFNMDMSETMRLIDLMSRFVPEKIEEGKSEG